MTSRLRIGSRPSPLALAQARLIKDGLSNTHGFAAEIVPISTGGDRMQTASLVRVGGKGLFVRELEQALSQRRIDLAVHSMKDLPATLAPQYRLAAVPARENPRDALIARTGSGWESLPQGARLGTSSLRRRLQVLRKRPDLRVLALRGNIDTRLQRLQNGDFDAIVLAIAGLHRLDRAGGIEFTQLDEDDFVPSGGQGALAVEALCNGPLAGSPELEQVVDTINHLPTLAEVTAERSFLAAIGASCVSPVGVLGTSTNDALRLRALLFSENGESSLSGELTHSMVPNWTADSDPARIARIAADLGKRLGQQLLERGGRELIVRG
jgi:hydroxymethylbilane synthase